MSNPQQSQSPDLNLNLNLNLTLNDPVQIGTHLVKNRIAKGAMSETLAPDSGKMTPELFRLYETWAKGGLGFCISGNVMIDINAKNEPGVLAIEDDSDLAELKRWAEMAKSYHMTQIIQLSHPGKQCPKGLNKETVAPSAIGFGPELSKFFGKPKALSEPEIEAIIKRFGRSAQICEQAGFAGIQLHGAHGYLISQFLSPIHNQRDDQWGGTIENRMRFAIACYQEVRRQTSDQFIVGIKLNSSDFQKGGFSEDDAIAVFKALDELDIDFIEISGGTYEAPAMTGAKKASTAAREAYFLAFAQTVRQHIKTKIMVTGGFRTHKGMSEAVQSGDCDLIGLARPLAIEPDAPHRILKGLDLKHPITKITTGIAAIDRSSLLEIVWYAAHFRAIGNGKQPDPNLSPFKVMGHYAFNNVKAIVKGQTRFRA